MVPEDPPYHSGQTSTADNGNRGDSVLEDARVRAYEDCDRANMLYNDRRVGDEWPKVVGSQARVTLKMVEEGFGIGVVVGIYAEVRVSGPVGLSRKMAVHTRWMFDPQQLLPFLWLPPLSADTSPLSFLFKPGRDRYCRRRSERRYSGTKGGGGS